MFFAATNGLPAGIDGREKIFRQRRQEPARWQGIIWRIVRKYGPVGVEEASF